MKFEMILDTENGTIDILYSSYNIISKTIYNEDLTAEIKDLIQTELYEDLEKIIERD